MAVYGRRSIDASEKSEDKKLGIEIYLIKENIKILGLLYALGVVSGIIIELVIRLI